MSPSYAETIRQLVHAALYAAEKHTKQRRKGDADVPYINHPLKVCKILTDAGITDIETMQAAMLHDVVEDTDTPASEIEMLFGQKVCSLVLEVTDDKTLSDTVRKELQVSHASKLSHQAKLIKIADKISNMHDIVCLNINWNKERKLQYLHWSKRVADKCAGVNEPLDLAFQSMYAYCLQQVEML